MVKGRSDEIAETEADTADDRVDHKMCLGKISRKCKGCMMPTVMATVIASCNA